jgi:hypothetical protein
MVRVICGECIAGAHQACDSEDCPCCCNDSDFRWARNRLTAMGQLPPSSDPALTALLRIRPDLASLVDA